MKLIFVFLALSIVLFGCQKEINFDTPSGGGGTGGGGSTGTSNSYQPLGKNSYWKYHETGTFSGDFTITSTGQTRSLNGINYTVCSASPPTSGFSEEWFGTSGHDLYSYFEGAIPNSSATIAMNFLYTNDTASVGYQWQVPVGQANGINAVVQGSIIEKGFSLTVGGKNFDNVIHSSIVLQYVFPGIGAMNAATYDYYVAKGVGIIRIESVGDPTFSPGVHTLADITEYSIK